MYVVFRVNHFLQLVTEEGLNDKRGNVFYFCYKVIKHKKPSYFILENVRGLLSHDKGETWKIIWSKLKKLKNYNIYWRILNTRDYGIPQNRERLFIVGVKKPLKFSWPKKKKMKSLEDFMDKSNNTVFVTTKRQQKIINKLDEGLFIDFAFGTSSNRSFINSAAYCSCITANSRIWCVPQKRYTSCEELLALQGFKNFKQIVSNTQMKKQIGNSMSVNVLKEILKNLLKESHFFRTKFE
jgi:DNA (cytosine-5)-methyltransferase 1